MQARMFVTGHDQIPGSLLSNGLLAGNDNKSQLAVVVRGTVGRGLELFYN